MLNSIMAEKMLMHSGRVPYYQSNYQIFEFPPEHFFVISFTLQFQHVLLTATIP